MVEFLFIDFLFIDFLLIEFLSIFCSIFLSFLQYIFFYTSFPVIIL